jgi:hypothetical protein
MKASDDPLVLGTPCAQITSSAAPTVIIVTTTVLGILNAGMVVITIGTIISTGTMRNTRPHSGLRPPRLSISGDTAQSFLFLPPLQRLR